MAPAAANHTYAGGGTGAPAAARASARNRRGSPVSSGCHCTPIANPAGPAEPGASANSTASTVPSAAHAVATSPAPSRSTA